MSNQTSITAEELNDNVGYWEAKKDAGECRFLYQGDYVDGIGDFNGGYIIEHGGINNDPSFVYGDTVLQIEWISP